MNRQPVGLHLNRRYGEMSAGLDCGHILYDHSRGRPQPAAQKLRNEPDLSSTRGFFCAGQVHATNAAGMDLLHSVAGEWK